MATINESLSEGYVLPDEVLIEILLRFPLLSLQLFRSVSKHWLSLITSEYFISRLQKPRIETPCGLFISEKPDSEYSDLVTLGPKVTSFPLRATIAEAGSHLNILHSCNGLYLCRKSFCHYVYNPFTNQFKNIPFARLPWCPNMRLAFDPTKSPYYKVVTTEKNVLNWDWGEDWEQYWEQDQEGDRKQHWEEDSEEDSEEDIDTEQILIYSSKTGKWRICGSTFHIVRFWGIGGGIYWNNAIHWISSVDDGLPLHSKFDIVDHPIITNIQTPTLGGVVDTSLFESRGSLLLLMKDFRCCYQVFEMREESSGWSVKYIIDDIVNILPDLYWQLSRCIIQCIVLGERDDDTFIVLKLDNKILRYNFVSKTVSTLSNFRPFSCWSSFPFIASLASS